MLKAYSWWNYKVPPMLAVAFYALYRSPALQPVTTSLWQLGLFMISVIGIAGFGHLFLDAFDVAEDRAGGKPNLWDNMGGGERAALVTALLAASWLPWIILPNTRTGFVLIALEFVLFALYAVPPVRLKARGLAGVVTDAGYAHMLPALWTWIPFTLIAGIPAAPGFAALLGAWALVVGIRHLMQHQALEASQDEARGTQTFAVRHGALRTFDLVARRVIPLEIVAFLLVVLAMSSYYPAVALSLGVYVLFEVLRFRFLWLQRINVFAVPAPDGATIAGTLIMSQFYELWLPVILLAGLCARSPSYALLLVIYLLLFRNGPAELVRRDVPLIAAWLRSRGAKNGRPVIPIPE